MTKTLIRSQEQKQTKFDNLSQSYTPNGYGEVGLGSTSASKKIVKKTGGNVKKYRENRSFIVNTSVDFKQQIDFEQHLAKRKEYVQFTTQKAISEKKNNQEEKTLYDKFEESGLIGFCSVEEDLSTTYKQVLSDTLNAKYDHR